MPMRTLGVEEELLLVDPDDGTATAAGEQVVQQAEDRRADLGREGNQPPIDREFKEEQAEIGSSPTTSAGDLAADLRRLRRELASAAEGHGAHIAAVATSPLKVRPTATDDDRYHLMIEEFGLLAREQLTCGQHVHVSIESRAEGVAVLDRIAPWLSVITAMSANSPFWQAKDTGYGSYRTVVWGLWPTAGPTAGFGDETGYDTSITDLLASGAAMDDGMIYFDARLSAHYPTLEIRVADVCTDVDDAVLVAVLARALVETAAAQWQAGEAAPDFRSELLKGMSWRAARHGLSGDLLDPRSRKLAPAFDVIDGLVEWLEPSLTSYGDLPLVQAGVDRLRNNGNGADRQRRSFQQHRDLEEVVADIVRRTLV